VASLVLAHLRVARGARQKRTRWAAGGSDRDWAAVKACGARGFRLGPGTPKLTARNAGMRFSPHSLSLTRGA
jgi:hypothetical protein